MTRSSLPSSPSTPDLLAAPAREGGLLVPATPDLLDGWCGPVGVPPWNAKMLGTVVVVDTAPGARQSTCLTTLEGVVRVDHDMLFLDLSSPECADRGARVLASRLGARAGVTAPLFRRHDATPEFSSWALWDGEGAAHIATSVPCSPTRSGHPPWPQFYVPALAAIDPNHPRIVPSGARWVDLRALALWLAHTTPGKVSA